MTKALVGLHGFAQSGKDTFGKVLVNEFGYTRRAFADPLKQILAEMNPLVALDGVDTRYRLTDLLETEGWEWVKFNTEARNLLQSLGRSLHELPGQDVLLDAGLRSLDFASGARYVFTDVRYPSEFKALKNLGGVLWHIERAGVGPVNSDASESLLAAHWFDVHITVQEIEDPEALDDTFRQLAETYGL